MKKFPFKTLIAVIGVVLIVFIIFLFIYLAGGKFFPGLKIEVFKIFSFQSGEVVGPNENKYSLEFENQSIFWASERLDKMASNVNIIVTKSVSEVETIKFSISLNDASIVDFLNVFCEKASPNGLLTYRKEGKNYYIDGVK